MLKIEREPKKRILDTYLLENSRVWSQSVMLLHILTKMHTSTTSFSRTRMISVANSFSLAHVCTVFEQYSEFSEHVTLRAKKNRIEEPDSIHSRDHEVVVNLVKRFRQREEKRKKPLGSKKNKY